MRTVKNVKDDLEKMNYNTDLIDQYQMEELMSLPAESYQRKLTEMDIVRTEEFLEMLENIEFE